MRAPGESGRDSFTWLFSWVLVMCAYLFSERLDVVLDFVLQLLFMELSTWLPREVH